MIIAQLSDIHAAPDNDNLARLELALGWLERIKPDVLVVTGDLVDDNWVAGYQAIACRLNKQVYPALILPGNSDNPASMLASWGSQNQHNNHSADALHFLSDIKGMRLIGVDTTVNGTAAGSITEHLPWLEKALCSDRTTPSMLFLHHHVFPSGIAPLDEVICAGYKELAELLQSHPGRPLAIASGHVHRPVASNLAGIPAYICGSICPANPLWFGSETIPPANDPPSLMIHGFINGSLVSHHVPV